MLYTIVNLNDVFPQPQLPKFECKKEDNRYIEGYQTKGGFVITRLMSTDPRDYLDHKYDIGNIYH